MLTTRCLCSPLLSIASAHQWQVLSAERMPNPHPHPRPHPHQVLSAELMPNRYRSLGMALGNAVGDTSLAFVSKSAHELNVGAKYGLAKTTAPVSGTRSVAKRDMVLNDACPSITVDAETFEVKADGEVLTCDPASEVPLARSYFLF